MRVLDVHAAHCSFETVAAPPAEDAPDSEEPTPDPADDADAVPAPSEGGFDDCLVAFVAVEGDDARRPTRVAAEAAAHLDERAENLRVARILVYPCPALSERTVDHETAVEGCRALARALSDDLEVVRAPVGWHRALSLETAGHPFAESVNRFTGAPRATETDPEWTVVDDGERRDASAALSDLDEATRAAFEVAMDGPPVGDWSTGDPSLARGGGDAGQPGLAESDGLGGRRLLPAGRLVHDLLADRVHERLLEVGAAPIETAVTYDPSDPETARLLGAFGQVEPSGARGARLRPSARLGALAFLRDATLAPADCPLWLTETGPVDRGRGAATVPTAHAVTADRDAAWAALGEFADLATTLNRDCGLAAAPVCYPGGGVPPARVDSLAGALGRPLLVHRDCAAENSSRRVRLEFHDAARDPADAPHVRLAPELAERAGIAFEADATGANAGAGTPEHPVIVDCAPLGSLDGTRRACWASPPVWLAPTQVRFVTVDGTHRERAAAFATELSAAGCRADVDDRPRPVGERLDRAADDRVPFVVVVGEREADDGDRGSDGDGTLNVWDRREDLERALSLDELEDAVDAAAEGCPRRERYLPLFVEDGPLRGTRRSRDEQS